MATKLQQLKVEEASILTRQKRRKAAEDRDRKRLREIDKLIHREEIAALVGVQDAVKIAYRNSHDHPYAWLNDARATILRVARTRATLVWDRPRPSDGFAGEFTCSLDLLKAADEMQGCTVQAMRSGDGLEGTS